MPFSLVPDFLFRNYNEITPEFLQKHQIRLLLSDLDFTLAPKKIRHPDQALKDWIATLQAHGITLMIISNNRSSARVSDFCTELKIDYQGHARKPSPRGLQVAMHRAHINTEHTAMLGDKLLTDVLAAKRAGVLALMVEPAGGAVTFWQKILHALQTPFKKICQKR